MVTAEISVKLRDQPIFSLTVFYSGGDEEWEQAVAIAAQASMQKALEDVQLPDGFIVDVSDAKERR